MWSTVSVTVVAVVDANIISSVGEADMFIEMNRQMLIIMDDILFIILACELLLKLKSTV